MNFVTSISLVVLGAMFLALLGWGSIRAAWRNCEGRRGVFAALAILAAICSIVAQKPSPDTPTITVDALLRDVGCYATNNVFHAAVTNAPSYAGVDFSDCDLMVYARERASTDAASWFELTPRKKFSQQPADYAIENATNYNYMVYLSYVPPSPVHTNGVFELYGFVIENEAQGEPDQLAAGFINSRAVPLPFDAEVEFLESTGTQWVDTGVDIASSDDARFVITCTITNTVSSSYSTWVGSGVLSIGGLHYVLDQHGIRTGGGSVINAIPYNRGDIVTIDVYYDSQHRRTCKIGQSIYQGTAYNAQTARLAILNYPAPTDVTSHPCQAGKLFHVEVYKSGVLVRDYIPVRKGTTGALYDKRGVGGMNPDGSPRNDGMYFNRGTGNFGYGNDK